MGRKYGLGKYGKGTYDLGPFAPVIPPWVPIPVEPGEVWIPTVDMEGCWGATPSNGNEIWKPVLMPVSS